MNRILGIETSCDETAVAIVDGGREVRCNLIATQFDVHAKYGGVVPELASRAHIESLDHLVREALDQTGFRPETIDAVAVTCGPGLIGSLLIGVTAAKTLAWAWHKPLIGINHTHAHATSATIELDASTDSKTPADRNAVFPAVALVVSGGHTSLFHVRDYADVELLGATIDDAAGEAFDKVAVILDLGYPGGPLVDARASRGDADSIRFPRAMLERESLDFSFSGLKTSVLYHVHGPGKTRGGLERLTDADVADICAAFSAAVVDVLVDKTMRALGRTGAARLFVGGGVAANSMLRKRLAIRCTEEGIGLHLTPMPYCTDNAAMIAALGGHLFARGQHHNLNLTAQAGGCF